MFRSRVVALFVKNNGKALYNLRGTTPSRVLNEESYRLFSIGATRKCLDGFRSFSKERKTISNNVPLLDNPGPHTCCGGKKYYILEILVQVCANAKLDNPTLAEHIPMSTSLLIIKIPQKSSIIYKSQNSHIFQGIHSTI
ncbi:hypothetical protein GBA52_026965 [Prunus armeniaca]|nr:hypothetical protein GBA52_026965 [Prunus armeniaca]